MFAGVLLGLYTTRVIKGTVKIRLKWFGDIFELSEKGVRDALVDPRGVFRIQSNI